jgi:hypothetical protein
MNSRWQPIDTPETADQAWHCACWDDYPLVDWIFCRSLIQLEDNSDVEGQALRLLAQAWGQPASHVEIALFDFETFVPLPPAGDFLKLEFLDSGRIAVRFSRDAEASVCASGCFRLLELSDWGAARLYRHPSVLAPIESTLTTEGLIEYSGDAGERLIIAGGEVSPTLWISDSKGRSSAIKLRPGLSNWLLEAIHSIGKSKSEQGAAGQPATTPRVGD